MFASELLLDKVSPSRALMMLMADHGMVDGAACFSPATSCLPI